MACSSKPVSMCTSSGCGSSNCTVRPPFSSCLCHLVQHPQSFPECLKVCDEERPMVLKSLQAGALAASSPPGLMLRSLLLYTHLFCIVCHNMESRSAPLLCVCVCVSLGDPRQQLDSCCVFSCCGGVQGLQRLPLFSGATSKWRPQLSSRQPPTSLSGLSRFPPSSHFILSLFSFETWANSSVCCLWNLTWNERLVWSARL